MTVIVPGPAGTKPATRRTIEEPGPDTAPGTAERRTSRPRSAAAQRAYARRAQREGRPVERAEPTAAVSASSGRARFVVLIISLLVVGIATTLWLTTQAIADSYRLERVRQQSTDLSERADTLQREVTGLDSPSALAERAKELGMVFPGEPARLVVQPDGSVALVGEPRVATQPPPPPPPAPDPAAAQQPAQQDQQPAQEGQQPEQQPAQQSPAGPQAGAG